MSALDPVTQALPAEQLFQRLALVVALVVAISIPNGYCALVYRDVSDTLDLKSRIKAAALSSLIAQNPDTWQFAENRLNGLIGREPLPLAGERVEVHDVNGKLLTGVGAPPLEPSLTRRSSLYDAGQVVGDIQITTSLRPQFLPTLLSICFGLLLGLLVYWTISVLPLRALRRATQALSDEKERAEATLRSISDAVITINPDGRLSDVNPAAVTAFEAESREQLLGRPVTDFVAQEFHDDFARLKQRVLNGETAQTQYQSLGFKGGQRWLDTIAVPLRVGDERVLLAVARDITERRAAEEEIRNLAFHDHLTGLPNRRQLVHRLGHLIGPNGSDRLHSALIMLDLDNFKTLNDTMGHDVGDKLLIEVGRRLSASIRRMDSVSRLGGDEFVVILEELSPIRIEAASQAESVARKILATLNRPYFLGHHTARTSPSMGIALFQGRRGSWEDLLKQADLAMYQAKAAGRNTLRFFDPSMHTAIVRRAELELALRDALEKQELALAFQGQTRNGGNFFGAEVLIRWRSAKHGQISPAEFIPLAEESGIILDIGRWVLESACATLVRWTDSPALRALILSVNISPVQLRQPGFVDDVRQILDRTGANPSRLKFELTESTMIANVEETIATMSTLKGMGIGFSLDDFGTGYSSLAMLKRLPLDQLKIDQSFVRDILDDPNDAAIARTIIALAEAMGLDVIAEGVETLEQAAQLTRMQCHTHQGYLYSRPIPENDFENVVHASMTGVSKA